MWTAYKQCGAMRRNPDGTATIKGATKRTNDHSLSGEESPTFSSFILGSLRTMALLCVRYSLRISEALALKWESMDRLNSKLRVECGR